MGLVLGVKREVAEDVLVMRTGRAWQSRGQAALLILKQHYWQRLAGVFNIANNISHVKIYHFEVTKKCENCYVKKENESAEGTITSPVSEHLVLEYLY